MTKFQTGVLAAIVFFATLTPFATGQSNQDSAANDHAIAIESEDKESIDSRVTRSLGWLLDFCSKDRKFSLSDANNRAKSRVVILQTAFLLQVLPEQFKGDSRRKFVIDKAEDLLAKGVSSDFSFESWVAGFASLYAFEESVRTGKRHSSLEMLGQSWADRQNREGGWRMAKPVEWLTFILRPFCRPQILR